MKWAGRVMIFWAIALRSCQCNVKVISRSFEGESRKVFENIDFLSFKPHLRCIHVWQV